MLKITGNPGLVFYVPHTDVAAYRAAGAAKVRACLEGKDAHCIVRSGGSLACPVSPYARTLVRVRVRRRGDNRFDTARADVDVDGLLAGRRVWRAGRVKEPRHR